MEMNCFICMLTGSQLGLSTLVPVTCSVLFYRSKLSDPAVT